MAEFSVIDWTMTAETAARYNQLLELIVCYVEVSCCLVLHPSLLHTDSVVRCCYKRLCNVDMRQQSKNKLRKNIYLSFLKTLSKDEIS